MLQQLLRDLRGIAGDALTREGRVEILGSDPVLPTRFRAGELSAAALASYADAICELWELRSGRVQHAQVDVRAAAASLLSFAWQTLDGSATPRPAGAYPTVAMYPARHDRWIHLHGGFPKLREGTLGLLGCEDTPDSIAAAILDRDAFGLEEELAGLGMCGAVVRTPREWAEHPQGQTLAQRPVIELERIGDAPPLPFPRERVGSKASAEARPLSGIRVLDLTRVLAGPTCARTLAEHGADVLRVGAAHVPIVPPFVMDTGHGKRSTHLDLRESEDAERLRALVAGADVFSQGYRRGVMGQLGFAPGAVAALRPGIVYVSMNCYGHTGPWSGRPGWEQLAQAATGLAATHGSSEAPALLPAAVTDYTTGYLAAFGAALALLRQAREGGSWHVRASLSQTGMSLLRQGRTTAPGPGLGPADLEPWMQERHTPHGRLRFLGPVARFDETPAHWTLPSAPLGTHAPVWA